MPFRLKTVSMSGPTVHILLSHSYRICMKRPLISIWRNLRGLTSSPRPWRCYQICCGSFTTRGSKCLGISCLTGWHTIYLVIMPRPILLSNQSDVLSHQVHILRQWRSSKMEVIMAVTHQRRFKVSNIRVPFLLSLLPMSLLPRFENTKLFLIFMCDFCISLYYAILLNIALWCYIMKWGNMIWKMNDNLCSSMEMHSEMRQ